MPCSEELYPKPTTICSTSEHPKLVVTDDAKISKTLGKSLFFAQGILVGFPGVLWKRFNNGSLSCSYKCMITKRKKYALD